jgi:MGT family glycosyltransferase
MSKLIYICIPYFSHVNASLGLVKELVDSGEQVIFYSSKKLKERVEGTGAEFKFIALDENPEGENAWVKYDEILLKGIGTENYPIYPVRYLYARALQAIYSGRNIFDGIREDMKSDNADYIIHDYCLYFAEAARILGIPAISAVSNFSPGYRLDNVGLEPFIRSVTYSYTLPPFEKIPLQEELRMLELSTKRFRKAAEAEVESLVDTISGREKLNIVFSSKEFQLYPDSFDDSFKFVGPCLYNPDKNKKVYKKDGLRPLVYISFGSLFTDKLEVFKECIKAFSDGKIQVVMSIGKQVDISLLGEIPSNITVDNYVHQLEILKIADVFVSHVGSNSTHEAVWHNVPLVVLPQAFDQFLCAQKIEIENCGIYLKTAIPCAEDIRKAVEKVLHDPIYKQNISRFGETLRNAGGAKKAVEEIFRYKEENGIKN